MSPVQYARFLATGAAVAVVTIGCRELIGLVLGGDDAVRYSISVILAYAIGIAISFWGNRRFTFQQLAAEQTGTKFAMFVVVALIGMLSTWLLSLALRYGLRLERFIGKPSSASVAFATAALLSSLITYPLNALFVFSKRSRA